MPAGSSDAAVQRTSTATTKQESGSRLFVTTRRVPEVRNENDRTGGVQSNTCPICGKVFSTTYGRRRHVFSHTGERPHECPACDSKFVRKEYLRLHWRRHTGEKPYGCHLCPNDFARKDTLARHIRSLHERAKPHRAPDVPADVPWNGHQYPVDDAYPVRTTWPPLMVENGTTGFELPVPKRSVSDDSAPSVTNARTEEPSDVLASNCRTPDSTSDGRWNSVCDLDNGTPTFCDTSNNESTVTQHPVDSGETCEATPGASHLNIEEAAGVLGNDAGALAFHPAPLPRPVPPGMECVVEGHTISTEEWSDGSWQPSPGFRAQEKRRLELRQATPHQNAAQQATATRNDMKPRPPPQRKRGPLPRMPADTIHIVGRPKAPVDLTKLPPWQMYEALLKAASLPDQPPASRDKLRVHPTNNTLTISVPDCVRAQAYLRITSLQIEDRTIEFHVYAPPPDDAFRGIMFNAYDSSTDDEILKDLQESNPSMPVVGGRRMGRTNHVLVTMLGDCLPRWILYHGVYIRLYPFYPRVEACFNCRKVGHRTDVCPHPKRNRCSRCGQDHPPNPQGTQPTCLGRCIVCNGDHATNSSNCKYRFIKKPIPSNNAPKQAHNQEAPQQQPSILRNSRSPSQEHRFNSSSSPLPCSPNSSQGSSPSSSTPGPKELAWAQGPPESLKASPTSSPDAQVRELVRENSSLKAQLSSHQSQISKLMSQIGNLTQYIQSLEAKLDRTIAQPPATAPQPMEATSPPSQPQSQPAGKRKANTSTASLHAGIDIAAAVSKAVSAALTTLDAKFEARFNTLQQAIADTNSSLNALKSYTEGTNTSLNTLKNYTEATTAEINALRAPPAFAHVRPTCHAAGGPQTRNGLIMACPTLTVWQWNCRGHRKKRSHLQQLVQKLQADPQATEPAPDVIALQETYTPSTLPGYAAYHQLGSHSSPCTSTLVHNGLTAVQHEIEATGIQHTLVEILPRKRTDRSLFVMNVYSSPREKAADFSHLFSQTIALVGDAQLLLLGDFNARHPDWGYMHTDPKGRKLGSLQPPTRIGNSVCRDTSPDLTLCKNVTRATWDNTGLLAGSDHNILAITIETRPSKKPKPTARITEWPKFRKLLEERASDIITDINEWITSLQEHVQATTREVETTADLHTTDSRLLHMWDAQAGLLRRWRRQRHNKKLHRRLETLAREIENHSLALARQQWGQLCDGLNGQMSSKRTWHLLRQLLDPCSSKLSAQKQLQRLLHRYPGTDAELLNELALRYVSLASPDAPPEKLPPNKSPPLPAIHVYVNVPRSSHVDMGEGPSTSGNNTTDATEPRNSNQQDNSAACDSVDSTQHASSDHFKCESHAAEKPYSCATGDTSLSQVAHHVKHRRRRTG
ncbi:hypothetical protein HPB52_002556 [Rhipicephalus sanguineus]|uniref:Uncharacterized protein n=1 Tax=Rhipicephalus sanguineus TaxID=34632 RepID=A0A9D4SN21_RHISA|nr:hypothetical protein HPB52_002556 [Rhipicephalus sanguineus]